MRKNNLLKYVPPLDEVGEVIVQTEQQQTDLQYLKLLRKLEFIIAKIKEKRDDSSVL